MNNYRHLIKPQPWEKQKYRKLNEQELTALLNTWCTELLHKGFKLEDSADTKDKVEMLVEYLQSDKWDLETALTLFVRDELKVKQKNIKQRVDACLDYFTRRVIKFENWPGEITALDRIFR